MDKKIMQSLKDYFSHRQDVVMAFVFGSQIKQQQTQESDLDLAVYFKSEGQGLQWESEVEYDGEEVIWPDAERIVGQEVDLVVLNRVPSTLAFEVLRAGKSILIKDRQLYLSFLSKVSFEVIDFMQTMDDYWAIEQRSVSLQKNFFSRDAFYQF